MTGPADPSRQPLVSRLPSQSLCVFCMCSLIILRLYSRILLPYQGCAFLVHAAAALDFSVLPFHYNFRFNVVNKEFCHLFIKYK